MNKSLSIASRFSVSVVFIIVALTALSQVTVGFFFERNSRENFYGGAGNALSEFSDSITMFFEAKETELNVFAESDAVKAADDSIHSFANEKGEIQILSYKKSAAEEEIRSVCKSFARNDSDIAEIYLGTKWGGYATNFDGSMSGGYDPRKRGWYETASRGKGKVMLTDAFASTVGATVVGITRSAYSEDGEFIGNASIEVSLDTLTKILGKLDLGKGSFFMLVQADGTILADTGSQENNFKNVSEIGIPELVSFLSSEEKNGKLTAQKTSYLTEKIVNERTGYRLVAFCPTKTVFEAFHKTLSTTMIICILFGLFVSAATVLLTRKIMSPLKKMVKFVTDFVAALESGSDDYSPRIAVASKNEIGLLAESINLFISKLGVVMAQIRETQEKEHRISAKIFEETQSLSVATKETAATSQDSAAAVKEIVATMEDTNDLSENISRKIKDVSGVANSTSSDVVDGVAQIELNVKQLHEIFDANQQTIDGIKNLSEKIESIWDIVSLINNVADQAKIIAFNAELEASSAGEAGKSFRIVANEIRRLSDGIIDGTKEIKEKINEIQHSSDTLIIASESSTAKINAGYENARGLSDSFESIKKSAEITAKSADDIADIIQQQASASEQILIAIKEIASGVENFTVATDNISGAAENVRKISEELNNAGQE